MNTEKEYKAIVSMLNFNVNNSDEYPHNNILSINEIPSLKSMMAALNNINMDMVQFVCYLQDTYNIEESRTLWISSPKEFFSDHQRCINFINMALIKHLIENKN
jgi:hypothetical protein